MGTVYLVGAGPGAPDLLTLRAARLLAEADIVFYDALVHPETLALAGRAEKIAVGKRCGRHSTAQRFINKRLADAARRHPVVARLKGGDPMLFGRAQEEIAFLSGQGIPVEVVPGVTAALGAAAELKVSLTQRGVARSVVFATPRAAPGGPASNWARAVASADTAVLYMASRDAELVKAELLAAGLRPDTTVAITTDVSLNTSSLRLGVLEDLPQLSADSSGGPALIIVGEVLQSAKSSGVVIAAATQLAIPVHGFRAA
ncbi:MAG TPA: uroporphyrinogen-III C-methyltransferase [Burkholderiales bacterium]|nr:uroporphyrinogen-III C-methyltransferase [Burkholderiales bacterium]